LIILVTITPNIYKLVRDYVKLTVNDKSLIMHDKVVFPVKSVQNESIENYKAFGKDIIKILDSFKKAF
jgi:hypothetical protein